MDRRRGGGPRRPLAQVGLDFAQVAHRGGSVTPGQVLLLVAGGLVLTARRRYPVAVMVAAYALTLSFQATQRFGSRGGAAWLAVIVAFATAIYLRRRTAALIFLVVCYVVSLWGPTALGEGHAPSAIFALSVGAGLAALVGGAELVRLRRQRSFAIAQGRREEARHQASEERLRLARDLHDIVAHNISVINVQANTALHLMHRQPERAQEALTTIHEVSKQALVELRTVLGGAARRRQPGAPRSGAGTRRARRPAGAQPGRRSGRSDSRGRREVPPPGRRRHHRVPDHPGVPHQQQLPLR